MIEADGIGKRYRAGWAVRGASFRLEPGSIGGLLGPNGAGKSTTIRMLVGLLAPDHGRVRLARGADPATDRRLRAELGYLPEATALPPEMTAEGYLAFRAALHGLSGRARRAARDRAIAACELADVRRRRIGRLSKGFRQRVGLAGAIVHDPSIVVLDEPANGLDPEQLVLMRGLLRSLAVGRTVLVSSHLLTECERVCDRILIMGGGRLRADGTPGELARMAPGAGSVRVEVREADAPRFAALVGASLDGASCESEPMASGWRRVRIGGVDGPAGAERIGALLGGHGVGFRELTVHRGSLEEAFAVLVSGPGMDAPGGPR